MIHNVKELKPRTVSLQLICSPDPREEPQSWGVLSITLSGKESTERCAFVRWLCFVFCIFKKVFGSELRPHVLRTGRCGKGLCAVSQLSLLFRSHFCL